MTPGSTVRARRLRSTVWREFWRQQFPIFILLIAAGVAAAFLQHGFVPGGERPFPLAGVRVPVWHVIWMGVWTGYAMALVGQASGVLALPYSISVLQFSNPHVTSTTQLLTVLNPLGALLGFRNNGQWNLDFAKWVCIGGVAGGLSGPFLRLTVLSEPWRFQLLVGLMLALVGINLLYDALTKASQQAAHGSGIITRQRVETVAKSGNRTVISYQGTHWSFSNAALFLVGAGVGVISAALGVGGGFLLVPIFVTVFRLPMSLLVVATIPYAIVLSAVGLFTYTVLMPILTSTALEPEWAWGLFAAAGGTVGSWSAAKTQRWLPEHFLKLMLGGVTGLAGALYVVNVFIPMPFRL